MKTYANIDILSYCIIVLYLSYFMAEFYLQLSATHTCICTEYPLFGGTWMNLMKYYWAYYDSPGMELEQFLQQSEFNQEREATQEF